jgi:hypothetical protein
VTVLRRAKNADFIISTVLLLVFVTAFLQAQEWPLRTKMFPVMVTSVGILLALWKMLVTLLPPKAEVSTAHYKVVDVELQDEDDETEQALEYVFESASRGEWVRALAWVGGFFIGLWLVGAVPAVLAFGISYLLVEARTKLLVAVTYPGILAGMLYATQQFLNISMPPGILFG